MLLTLTLPRRLLAEFLGTAALLVVVVGSGIAASRLTDDQALVLLVNAVVTAAGLAAIVAVFAPLSGAHLNPVVSLTDWAESRVRGHGLSGPHVAAYVAAQVCGAVAGAILANAMFSTATHLSTHHRSSAALWLSEVVATAGLVFLIFTLTRTGRGRMVPVAVGAYIGAAYWWSSSTSFANPAATIGRAFTNTYAGIAPSSVPGFVMAQLIGTVFALAGLYLLVPGNAASTGTEPERVDAA